MRKCYACQQMKAVVLVTKKPNGKRGYICSTCHEDSANDWYYWSRNQYGHFIVWRNRDNQVARATVWRKDGPYHWNVIGPCWSTYLEHGQADLLEDAKQEVETRVTKIIEQEFKPEYVHPLG